MNNRVKVSIGHKEYNVEIADTNEARLKGLQNREYLAPDEGMLFVYDEEQSKVDFWMKDCNLELDIIGIDEDGEVNTVYKAIPNDETLIPFPNAKYILEVNTGSEIVEGDDFYIDESDDLNKYTMKVLAPDGSTQFLLQGGERIFSRISTRKMIKLAKLAEENKNNEDKYLKVCKRLGKAIFKELKAQDGREPEYVTID